MIDIVIKAILPLILIGSLGAVFRKSRIIKEGQEAALSAFLLNVSFPSLFFLKLSALPLTARTGEIAFLALAPLFVLLILFFIIYKIFKLNRDTYYLLNIATFLGNVAFIGIAFLNRTYKGSEDSIILSAAILGIAGFTLSIIMLELYSNTKRGFLAHITKKLTTNPIILSIVAGMLFSAFGISLPEFIREVLSMLGGTNSVIAFFLIGFILIGTKRVHPGKALLYSLLRIAALPLVMLGMLFITPINGNTGSILVLMHAMPLAIALIVLVRKYNFHTNLIQSVVFLSTVLSIIYLPIYYLILENI